MSVTDYDLEVIRLTFPGWSVFRSDSGSFYATRRGVTLTNDQIGDGLHQTVSADDLPTFVELLRAQSARR